MFSVDGGTDVLRRSFFEKTVRNSSVIEIIVIFAASFSQKEEDDITRRRLLTLVLVALNLGNSNYKSKLARGGCRAKGILLPVGVQRPKTSCTLFGFNVYIPTARVSICSVYLWGFPRT